MIIIYGRHPLLLSPVPVLIGHGRLCRLPSLPEAALVLRARRLHHPLSVIANADPSGVTALRLPLSLVGVGLLAHLHYILARLR